MGADGVLPDRHTSVDVVHVTDRSRVTRLQLQGRAVVRKELLGPDVPQRRLHELEMLGRLRGVAGVAQLVDEAQFADSIVTEDAGGTNLAKRAKPLPAQDLIPLAIKLAKSVAGMHRQGVLHRDITPANVVVSDSDEPCLVEFGLATSLDGIRPEPSHHSEVLGTLAYLAPEMTGRTGRGVDQRADLYALGATLYELATGQPPFGFGEPLQLTHDHLARVPRRPDEVNHAIPGALSQVIMHLLEKEPDSRYQTAEGLIHDLERLAARPDGWDDASWQVGEHDVARRLLPPPRLVGRDAEVAVLTEAFEDARTGRCPGLLISGPAGVGKTALATELHQVVTASGGWFVTGTFDERRRDRDDALHWTFRNLARLLLAEPEEELARDRRRIVNALGENAGLLSAISPDFAALLRVPPEQGNPLTLHTRLLAAVVELLRAIASPARPVVMFLDDLQWAGQVPLGFVERVLSEKIDGVLLLGAYLEIEDEPAHPLAAALVRSRDQQDVRHLRLHPLSVPDSASMVMQVLRVDRAAAAELVEVIHPYTSGRPAQIMDLLNVLRRDGLLTPTADGWQWSSAELRDHLKRRDVTGRLAAHIGAMPARTRHLMEVIACLGRMRTELSLAQAATGTSARDAERLLVPALEDGLLLIEPGLHRAVRLRDEEAREVILRTLDKDQRRALHLAIARRLAQVAEQDAAAQYLPVLDALDDPEERRQVTELLRRTADQVNLVGDHATASALLGGVLQLLDADDTAKLIEVRTARHTALYNMGALDEADGEYRAILQLPTPTANRAPATAVQIRSLTHRNRLAEAIDVGLTALRELGLTPPEAAQADDLFGDLYRWLADGEELTGAPGATSHPNALPVADLLDAIMPAALFAGELDLHGWLSTQALNMWLEDDAPSAALSRAACSVGLAVVALRGDNPAGYRAVQRILARSEASGDQRATAHARFHLAIHSPWFEPLEKTLVAARRARDELIASGDLADAGYSYHVTAACVLDCAPTLDACLPELQAGLDALGRSGSAHSLQWLDSYLWLVDVLRGTRTHTADEALPSDTYGENPMAVFHGHLNHAIAAAIFGDLTKLDRHTAAAMPLVTNIPGFFGMGEVRVLRALALANLARVAPDPERKKLLAELAELTRWLAARAADAPDNFLHLLRLVEAEQAWALGDFRAAVMAFDVARREADLRHRPWHRAVIIERVARFHLEHGLERTATDLLAQARRAYADWGATAKTNQLDGAFPVLHTNEEMGDQEISGQAESTALTTETIDLYGILSASQALSSQTSVERLHDQVVQVLGSMTGATDVHLLLWDGDRQEWRRPAAHEHGGSAPVEGDGGVALPHSVLRYVSRTREPLVVADATRDDRFAGDPYFADLDSCSLAALPIFSGGRLRALLMLQSRLIHGAFTAQRLDGVNLIAGQLAVSLDNAQLYAESRRIAEEQATLRRVATLVARGAAPDLVFTAVAHEVGKLFHVQMCGVLRCEPDGTATLMGDHGVEESRLAAGDMARADALTASVRATRSPVRWDAEDAAPTDGPDKQPPSVRSMATSPILVEGRVWGAISVGSQREPLPAGIEHRLAAFTELIATAIANADSRAELAASRARIVTASDNTRRRIERDLHDGAQQRLISLALQVRAAQAGVPPELEDVRESLDRAVDEATEALDELRETARGIHPAVLTEGGLAAALRTLARRSPIPVELALHFQERLPEPVEVSAYYVAAEALSNASKHAEASIVTVAVDVLSSGGVLRLAVKDDGVGGADFSRGTGLRGLRDRVEAVGGRIWLESPHGLGTTITVDLPLIGESSNR